MAIRAKVGAMSDHRAERIQIAVRQLPMFRGLAPQDQQRIAAMASLRTLTKGEVLFKQGDAAETLMLILEGRVKIVRHGANGDTILEIFTPGETVAALAVYNGFPYPSSGVAMDHVSLLCLPRSEYFDLLERHPSFARSVIRELTRLNLSLTRKLAEMRGQRVETRIAQLFLTLADRMGRDGAEGLEVPMALSRQEIAEMVGTTVESSIRVMSRWGREGVLITGETGFTIPSRERLAEAAGADGT